LILVIFEQENFMNTVTEKEAALPPDLCTEEEWSGIESAIAGIVHGTCRFAQAKLIEDIFEQVWLDHVQSLDQIDWKVDQHDLRCEVFDEVSRQVKAAYKG
jgi:hypothetical protein